MTIAGGEFASPVDLFVLNGSVMRCSFFALLSVQEADQLQIDHVRSSADQGFLGLPFCLSRA